MCKHLSVNGMIFPEQSRKFLLFEFGTKMREGKSGRESVKSSRHYDVSRLMGMEIMRTAH